MIRCEICMRRMWPLQHRFGETHLYCTYALVTKVRWDKLAKEEQQYELDSQWYRDNDPR